MLIIDPQNDFPSEGGVVWDLVGDGVKNTKVVEHFVDPRKASPVAILIRVTIVTGPVLRHVWKLSTAPKTTRSASSDGRG